MLKRLSGVAMLALAACATTTTSAVVTPIAQLKPSTDVSRQSLLALNAICGADITGAPSLPNLRFAGGMGTGGFTVDSTVKDAQDWFDYGLALSHAFYHQDAIAAMRKASYADPNCALCAWGLAWAMGPTLNYGIDEKQRIEALVVAERAKSLAKIGDDKAERLTGAIVARYQKAEKSTEPTFGAAMARIAGDYPADLELAVLASHSLLIPVRAGDESGLKPALALLESVLKLRPDDTGAIHYYIHATEFDHRPEDALPYAQRLGRLAPAASHLVHMPAHTFFYAGRYEEAALVNAQAIEADADWLKGGGNPYAPMEGSKFVPMYYAHNLAFGLAGALMSGDGELALKYYDVSQKGVWKDNPPPPGRVYVALARYAPDRAMTIPELFGDPKFAIYRHYARGEAMLVKGDVAGARSEARAVGEVKGAADLPERVIARGVLEGRIAMAEGRPRDAARAFDAAAKVQEAKLAGFMDPPSWWYPVRRSVAAAYLKAGDYARAEAEADKSLKAWKHDPLALWVLGRAQVAQGHLGEGEATLGDAHERWRGDFDSITEDVI